MDLDSFDPFSNHPLLEEPEEAVEALDPSLTGQLKRPLELKTDFDPSISCSATAFDAWLKSQRNLQPKQFWEQPAFKMARCDFSGVASSWKLKPPSIGLAETFAQSSDVGAPEPHHQHVSMAIQRVRYASIIKTDDQLRWEALRKLKMIILASPSSTQLWRLLISSSNRLCDDSELSKSFCDAFSGKSTATLTKRSAALWRCAMWLEESGFPPLVQSTERALYLYMNHLQKNGHPTTAKSFLEAFAFLSHVAGLLGSSFDVVISTRTKGAANSMLAQKAPLRQAKPLKVKMVVALENIVKDGPYTHWRLFAGHFLFCLGSCCRFADSVHLDSIMVSESGTLQLIEASSRIFKTGATEEKRLPLISCGSFFAREPWAKDWMILRMGAGFGNDPAIKAFSEVTNTFMDRKMTTGEAISYLREILLGSGFSTKEVMEVGCHSLKTTLLAWSAMHGEMSLADRRLLGHHLDPNAVSTVTYARDELTRLQIQVQKMLREIRRKRFNPDEARVDRIAHALPADSDSEAGSEDVPSKDMERAAPREADKQKLGALDAELAECRIHKFSGVCHYKADSTKFFCGRKVTRKYDQIDNTVDIQAVPFSSQCGTAYKTLLGV